MSEHATPTRAALRIGANATHTGRGARRTLLAVLSAALLAACAAGPDYRRPDPPVPTAWAHADGSLTRAAEAETAFWRRFGDPQLADLVEHALRENHDLRIALARLDAARALLRQTRLDRLPTVSAGATASDARLSTAEAPGLTREQRDGERYEVAVEARWELDVFGRVRRQVEAGQAEADASAADLAALQVAIAGEVARNYFVLRGLQMQLQVAIGNADNQRGSLELVQARLDAGRGTAFDTARARAQVESTRARVPALEAELAATAHRIAVLTGREPTVLLQPLAATTPLPLLPASVAIGTPPDLLQRRPDVAAAERRLAAASARIGIATADLYPRFRLGGLLGSVALDSGGLFERDSESRLLALGIDWSFLDVGRVRARIAAADANAAAELARFQQSVLLALEDVETSLVRYARAERERAHLDDAALASSEAARLAKLRFDGGVVDFLDVLDAERAKLESEDRLAQARTRQATALVALYTALAGGWPGHVPVRESLTAAPPPSS